MAKYSLCPGMALMDMRCMHACACECRQDGGDRDGHRERGQESSRHKDHR